jgi:hypothetical protein
MLRLTSGHPGTLARLTGEHRGGRSPARWAEPSGASRGWLIAGLVAAGLGALAFYYLSPEMKRYMKIHNM